MALTGLTGLQPTNINVTGIATFEQTVGIAGTLTYEDVTNVDSVGMITARSGVKVNGGQVSVGAGTSLHSTGLDLGTGNITGHNLHSTGIITATTFSGSGASLTNLNGSNIASGTVPVARIGTGTKNTSTFYRGDGTFATVTAPAITTINNASNNRIVTSEGGTTVNSEANLTFDGNDLTITGTAPALNFIDTDADDYKIHNVQGLLKVTDTTASADRFVINDNGTGYFLSNFQIGSTTTSPGATLHIKSSYPSLKIDDGNNNTNAYIGIIAGTGKESNINFGDPADDDYSQISYDHNGDHMKFKIGGSEKFRVNSNGLCIGGTGSSNALDDYEEGSYTANFEVTSGSANFHNNTLHYVKIGSMCYVHGEIGTNSASSAGGDLRFDLPFTSKASGSNMDGHARGLAGAIWNYYGSSNPHGNYGWYPLHVQINSNVSNNVTFQIVGYNGTNSNWGPIGNLIGSGAQIGISFTYRTA
tara:strand:- start:33 stop:1457 length:1425 start_codon:yes stop_codon:yes gene_type:complete